MADDISVHLLQHPRDSLFLHIQRIVDLLGSDIGAVLRQACHIFKQNHCCRHLVFLADDLHGPVAGDDAYLQLFFYFSDMGILHSEYISLDLCTEIQLFYHVVLTSGIVLLIIENPLMKTVSLS